MTTRRACAYGAGRNRPGAQAWQAEVRSQLFELLHLSDLVANPLVDFDTQLVNSTVGDGYAFSELSFASTATRRIEAIVTLPVGGSRQLPAVVCVHGHGGSRHSVYDADSISKGFAARLATSGYATIAVDVGQHEVYEHGGTLMGERLWDCRRAVDWLVANPRVDADRIGCAGLSLGGEMTMWLGAMDPRIAATVSAGFLTTMDQMEQNHCMCWKFSGLRELVDFADVYALMAPRALQCQNGQQEADTQFCVPLARQALAELEPAYRDQDAEGDASLLVHPGGHEIDLPGLLAFFDRYLA